MEPECIPLRERKQAQTKLALLNAMIEGVKKKPLYKISVKELCESIPISEVTFYNYFPKKTDLLKYYIQLWSIEMTWNITCPKKKLEGIPAIEKLFELSGDKIKQNPALMNEIIVFITQHPNEFDCSEISQSEKRIAFPKMRGIEDISLRDFEQLFIIPLKQAIEKNQLPKKTNIHTAFMTLTSIFLGIHVLLNYHPEKNIKKEYQKQLEIIWKGLKAN